MAENVMIRPGIEAKNTKTKSCPPRLLDECELIKGQPG
jgi:hypothetical protein